MAIALLASGCQLGFDPTTVSSYYGLDGSGGANASSKPHSSPESSERAPEPSNRPVRVRKIPRPDLHVGDSCRSSEPGKVCLALKYVVYRDPEDGQAIEDEKAVLRNLEAINRLWSPCEVQFQIDSYHAIVPSEHQLRYRTANYSELQDIRKRFQSDRELLIVTTGNWDRSGSLGNSWANAWTMLPGPGGDLYGAILERRVGATPNVAAHELGHYLSLDHVDDQKFLMSPLLSENSIRLSRDECRSARWAVRAFWKKMMR